jgi:hypothetical protein
VENMFGENSLKWYYYWITTNFCETKFI